MTEYQQWARHYASWTTDALLREKEDLLELIQSLEQGQDEGFGVESELPSAKLEAVLEVLRRRRH
jgi:hypothetical protein